MKYMKFSILMLLIFACGKPVSYKGNQGDEKDPDPPVENRPCLPVIKSIHKNILDAHKKSITSASQAISTQKSSNFDKNELSDHIKEFEQNYRSLEENCHKISNELRGHKENVVCTYVTENSSVTVLKRDKKNVSSKALAYYCNPELNGNTSQINKMIKKLKIDYPQDTQIADLEVIIPKEMDVDKPKLICEAFQENSTNIRQLKNILNIETKRVQSLKTEILKNQDNKELKHEFLNEYYYLFSSTGQYEQGKILCEYSKIYRDSGVEDCDSNLPVNEIVSADDKNCNFLSAKKVKNELLDFYHSLLSSSDLNLEKFKKDPISEEDRKSRCVKEINMSLYGLRAKHRNMRTAYSALDAEQKLCLDNNQMSCVNTVEKYFTDFKTVYDKISKECTKISKDHQSCISKDYIDLENFQLHCEIENYGLNALSWNNRTFNILDSNLAMISSSMDSIREDLKSLNNQYKLDETPELKSEIKTKSQEFKKLIDNLLYTCQNRFIKHMQDHYKKKTSQQICSEYDDLTHIDDIALIEQL